MYKNAEPDFYMRLLSDYPRKTDAAHLAGVTTVGYTRNHRTSDNNLEEKKASISWGGGRERGLISAVNPSDDVPMICWSWAARAQGGK